MIAASMTLSRLTETPGSGRTALAHGAFQAAKVYDPFSKVQMTRKGS